MEFSVPFCYSKVFRFDIHDSNLLSFPSNISIISDFLNEPVQKDLTDKVGQLLSGLLLAIQNLTQLNQARQSQSDLSKEEETGELMLCVVCRCCNVLSNQASGYMLMEFSGFMICNNDKILISLIVLIAAGKVYLLRGY